jgi:hypothetical protein
MHRFGDRTKIMLNDPLFIVAAVAVLGVLVILMIGIGGFARGGDFNRKHANRIMRYRIYAQAAAVALILLYVTLRKYMGQ